MWVVTGGNGFIGSQMVRELNRRGITDILVVDPISENERPEPLQGARYQKLIDRPEFFRWLESSEAKDSVEWIIHMGANSSTTETNWDLLLDVNVNDSRKIYQWCSAQDKNLIYASSAATYGAGERGYDDRDDSEQLVPLNLYGKSKVEFDRWVIKKHEHPHHWYGLKFFNVYGPGEAHKGAMSSVVYKAFHQIQDSGKLQLFKSYKAEYGHGQQKRDFIYVKEVTNWIWELTQKRPMSGIYNMGTGQARTWVDLANGVFSAMDKKPQIDFIEMPESLREQYQYFTEARMQKWKAQGLTASQWSLEKGIDDYIRNHLLKR